MFNFFKKKSQEDTSDTDHFYEQGVIINIDLDSDISIGDSDSYKRIRQMEQEITELLSKEELYDGHEFGEGMAIVYVYGPSADVIWKKIEKTVRASGYPGIEVTLQYGQPENYDAEKKKIKL
jgi:hypothetical protein